MGFQDLINEHKDLISAIFLALLWVLSLSAVAVFGYDAGWVDGTTATTNYYECVSDTSITEPLTVAQEEHCYQKYLDSMYRGPGLVENSEK